MFDTSHSRYPYNSFSSKKAIRSKKDEMDKLCTNHVTDGQLNGKFHRVNRLEGQEGSTCINLLFL
jgi:hypothetical protein